MSFTERSGLTVDEARRLVDVAVVALLVVTLAAGLAAGVPPAGLAALVVASVAIETLATRVVTSSLLRTVDRDADVPAPLRATVTAVSHELGIDPLPVAFDADGATDVVVLGRGDRAVLLVSGPVVDELDGAALRGVVAHELGHVARGHFRAVPGREAVAHVVGAVALWVVALRGLAPGQAAVVSGLFLLASATRQHELGARVYLLGSLGTVLVPLALDAYATRLEECQADDVAVTHSSATAFCTGLYRITAAGETAAGGVSGPSTAGRGPLGWLTAGYPPLERRVARHGLALSDVSDRADRGTETGTGVRPDPATPD